MGGVSRADRSIGVRQSWVAVSRAAGTPYQNTTGRTIMVAAQLVTTGNGSSAYLSVDGVTIGGPVFYGSGGCNSAVSAIVPHGSMYQITLGAGASIGFVSELK